MANTFDLITTTSLTTAATNISFTGIPATYTDLRVTLTARSSLTSPYIQSRFKIQFNSDTSGNYKHRGLTGNGNSTGWSTDTGTGETAIINQYIPTNGAGANIFNNAIMYIPNYAGSTQKTVNIINAQENNIQTAYIQTIIGLWTGTAAITSIQLTEENGANLTAYSTASLYGIKSS